MPNESLRNDLDWNELEQRVFDIAIIGGGINGAGVALEAALRGYQVMLVEKSDYSSGATSASTRLIHGGLRYLEHFEFPLVRESLREREILLENAAGLVKPIPLSIPIYRSSRRGYRLIQLGMILYDLLSIGKSVPSHRMLPPAEVLRLHPHLRREGLRGGALYHDAQVQFPERLCSTIINRAREQGAIAANYCRAHRLEAANDCYHLTVEDLRADQFHRIQAKFVVNASGPWVDEVREQCLQRPSSWMGGTKGSHLVVRPQQELAEAAIYVEAQRDGRPIFVIPWYGYQLVGTTDLHYDGSLDEVTIDREEVDYLLSEYNHLFPDHELSYADIVYTYSGIRPLPAQERKRNEAITRRHYVRFEDGKRKGSGIVHLIGGKLTTYRSLAEEAVSKIARRLPDDPLKSSKLSRSFDLMNPMPDDLAVPGQEHSDSLGIGQASFQHLLKNYGSDADAVLRLIERQPALGEPICHGRPDLLAQAVYAVQAEQARNLDDIFFRRLSLGWNECLGLDCCTRVAVCVAPLLGWDEERQQREIECYRETVIRRHLPAFLPAARQWQTRLKAKGQ